MVHASATSGLGPVPPWPSDLAAFPTIDHGCGRGISNSSAASGAHPGPDVHGPGASSLVARDLGDESESIADFFSQLWAIPSSPRPSGRLLCWVRKGVPDSEIPITDCVPAARSALLHHRPRQISLLRVGGSRPSYAEVVQKASGAAPPKGRGCGRGAAPVPPRGSPSRCGHGISACASTCACSSSELSGPAKTESAVPGAESTQVQQLPSPPNAAAVWVSWFWCSTSAASWIWCPTAAAA